MLKSRMAGLLCVLAATAISVSAVSATGTEGKRKLKIFILAGQSNMVGHAKISTFDYIGDDPKTVAMLNEMGGRDGKPRVVENTWITFYQSDILGDPQGEGFGPLTAGYGARKEPTRTGEKIGPEFTFGIYMQRALHQPILIIKAAWGGKSLFLDFRPPSAGPYELAEPEIEKIRQRGGDLETERAKIRAKSGHYYRLMIGYVKQVLKDIKRVCPVYDEQQGYDIAGFVWFQGWNDLVNRHVYPRRGEKGGYDKYSEWLSMFIRDVRNDLKTPDLPFVIGVMGVGGPIENVDKRYQNIHQSFREAMAAPAALDEFKRNVLAVQTAPFWEIKLDRIMKKRDHYNQRLKQLKQRAEKGELTTEQLAAERKIIEADTLSAGEAALLKRGASNAAYHYLGCAKTMGLIGKAFADGLLELQMKAESRSPRIVNIINFIRQCEPRIDWITEDVLYETVVEQINIMKKYHLKGTFLLQYDALMDTRYQKLLKGLPPEMFEIGAWWEIPQPLVENSGYKWRGRYPWDWHADVGFATGYTPAERERLVDRYMTDFKKIFGYYPKSVGSWFIDAHTLQYMVDRYRIVASCNCKDQIGTDGYTLWGGYWNQGYYPSKKNAYMPAQNEKNQIPVPIFRMLGSDPIHQYDNGLGTNRQRVISLEPVYLKGGGNPDWCKWYFDAFVDGAAMAYGYVQVGQENSFTWKKMAQGFNIQLPLIAQLLAEGRVTLKTLGETGEWFRSKYNVTPPTSVTVLNDYTKKNQKTVWFNSRFYRANLLWDKGTLRFRDIHLFDEAVISDYLTKRGTSTQCDYYTLPFVDGFRWSSSQTVAGLRFKSGKGAEIEGGDPTVDDRNEGELVVRWPIDSPEAELVIIFDEKTVNISIEGGIKEKWFLELSHDKKADLPFLKIESKEILCNYKNAPYSVSAKQGLFSNVDGSGLRIIPEENRIVLDFSSR